MVNMIKKDAHLVPYLTTTIEDTGIEVGLDQRLCPDDFAAIKVDDYYAGLKISTPPKAVDFVVIVDCQCDSFSMYILELKNVNGPGKLNIVDIQEKFSNTINLFLSNTFSYIFLNDRFKYKEIKMYLVSDAYGEAGNFANHSEYLRFRDKVNKKDTLKVDMSLSEKALSLSRKNSNNRIRYSPQSNYYSFVMVL